MHCARKSCEESGDVLDFLDRLVPPWHALRDAAVADIRVLIVIYRLSKATGERRVERDLGVLRGRSEQREIAGVAEVILVIVVHVIPRRIMRARGLQGLGVVRRGKIVLLWERLHGRWGMDRERERRRVDGGRCGRIWVVEGDRWG